MPSYTVALERSAYERLKAAKRPGESFSVTINRLLARNQPSFRALAGTLTAAEAEEVWAAIARMRKSEAAAERAWAKDLRSRIGGNSRH